MSSPALKWTLDIDGHVIPSSIADTPVMRRFSGLLDVGMEFLKRGTEFETGGEPEQALDLYKKGLEAFKAALELEMKKHYRDYVQEKISRIHHMYSQFLERGQRLKKLIGTPEYGDKRQTIASLQRSLRTLSSQRIITAMTAQERSSLITLLERSILMIRKLDQPDLPPVPVGPPICAPGTYGMPVVPGGFGMAQYSTPSTVPPTAPGLVAPPMVTPSAPSLMTPAAVAPTDPNLMRSPPQVDPSMPSFSGTGMSGLPSYRPPPSDPYNQGGRGMM